jgi:hypothetical protein
VDWMDVVMGPEAEAIAIIEYLFLYFKNIF